MVVHFGMVFLLSIAAASCLQPMIHGTLEGGPGCVAAVVETLERTQADLAFSNTCGEAVQLEAQGGCQGCAFARTVEDGGVLRVRVAEEEANEHAFSVSVTGATLDGTIEAVVTGTDANGRCRDHGLLCAVGPGDAWVWWGWTRR